MELCINSYREYWSLYTSLFFKINNFSYDVLIFKVTEFFHCCFKFISATQISRRWLVVHGIKTLVTPLDLTPSISGICYTRLSDHQEEGISRIYASL